MPASTTHGSTILTRTWCGATTTTPTTELTDSEIYDKVLKEFYTAYSEALDTDILDERYAKMAIAEAKLLESGVILPRL